MALVAVVLIVLILALSYKQISYFDCVQHIKTASGTWTDESGLPGNYISFSPPGEELTKLRYIVRQEYVIASSAVFFKQPEFLPQEKVSGAWTGHLSEPTTQSMITDIQESKANPFASVYSFSFDTDIPEKDGSSVRLSEIQIDSIDAEHIVMKGVVERVTRQYGQRDSVESLGKFEHKLRKAKEQKPSG